jgi:hypothetical protein
MLSKRARALAALAGTSALALAGSLPAHATAGAAAGTEKATQSSRIRTVTSDLEGPRGLAVLNKRKVIVGQADGTVSRVVKRPGMPAKIVDFAHVPPSGTGVGPAVARGLHGTVWILTGGAAPDAPGPLPAGSATLYKWRPHHGAPKVFADIGAYQKTDPDPYDLESNPTDSNPFGVVALPDGSVLVSDAAGNDLLRVKKNRKIQTVARLKPRTVAAPNLGPDGPPPGTMMPAEAVATSVTVKDGAWFVGELRGFPATPGTSEIWKIKPGSRNAVCDPDHPRRGHCTRYVDGLTSIVDRARAGQGLYALVVSTACGLGVGGPPTPGATTGALFKVRKHHIGRELAKGKLTLPGGVDRRDGALFVVAPTIPAPAFGPGTLYRLR